MSAKPDELIEDTAWQSAPPPPAPRDWRPWGVAAGVALLLALAYVWWRRRTRRRGGTVSRRTVWRPNRTAMKALAALERRVKVDGDDDRFVADLSGVVRVYLQERFGLRAPHRSTEEFLREAAASDLLSDDHRSLLGAFLTRADPVKFARRSAGYDLRKDLLDAGRSFVTSTDPSKMPWVAVHRANLQEA